MSNMCQLYNGDCLDVLPTLEAKSATFIFNDLPYGTTQCKWDVLIDPIQYWKEVERVRSGHVLLMTGGWPFYQIANIANYKHKLYWNKKFGANFTQMKRQPMFTVEEIEVYYSGVYNPQMIERDTPIKSGKRANARTKSGTDEVTVYDAPQKTYTTKFPESLISIPRELGRAKLHATQKPESLMEYLIRTYTNPGDTVLDPTMGSGTTGVAALKLNRRFIGIEKDTGIFNIAQERIQQYDT